MIKATITKTIGATGDYVSITAAWAAIPGIQNPITEPWIFEIKSNYNQASETFPVNLTAINGASLTNTITIRPQTGVAALTISSGSAVSVFKFNGADYVTIDGRAGGVGASQLTIENTQTATSIHAIHFTADAIYNTLNYCTIKGSSYATSNVQNASVIAIDEGSATTNCDNTTITNCTITKSGSNKPACLIGISRISVFTSLDNTTISSNSFSDFDIAAIYSPVQVSTTSITNNSFFQSATWGNLAANSYGIYLVYTSNANMTITGNYIGGQASSCAGSPLAITSNTTNLYFTAIKVSSYGSTPTISSNTIKNISFTQATNANSSYGFIGFEIGGTSNFTIGSSGNGNAIGSTTGTGSITVAGAVQANFLGVLSTGTGTTSIAYNTIGAISMTASTGTITGISTTATSTTTIDNNTIGSSVANNISSSANALNLMISITSLGTYTISNNLIQQISLTGASTSTVFSGIYVSTNATITATGNTICNITSNGTSSAIYANNGIYINSTVVCSVNSNTIGSVSANNISFSGNSPSTGIIFNTTGTYTCNNNTIQQYNLTGGSTTTSFHGIYLFTHGTLTATGNTISNITCNGTSAAGHFGIRFRSNVSGSAISNTIGSTTSNNMTFSGNTNINAISFNSTGTYTCTNNTIQQFNITNAGTQTVFRGIYMTSGILTATGNMVKNITCAGTGNGSFSVCGINNSGTTGNHVMSSNIFQNFTTAGQSFGIYLNTTVSCTVNSNTLGNTTANNMTSSYNGPSYGIYALGGVILTCNSNTIQNYNFTSTGTSNSFSGIYINAGTASINSNSIKSITSLSKLTTVSGGELAINGIYLGTGGHTVNQNKISNLILSSSTAGSYSISGIHSNTGSGTNTLTKNKITEIGSAGTSASTLVVGIHLEGLGTIVGSNNIILLDNGTSVSNSVTLEGIKNDLIGAVSLYHNTVKIYGTATSNSGSSSCYKNGGITTVNLRNNIFQNIRTNSGATGKHYAINYNVTPGTVNSESYNYVEASGTGGYTGFLTSDRSTLINWQSASGTGSNNKTANLSINSYGQVLNGTSTDIVNNGTDLFTSSLVTDDYLAGVRSTTPCRGAFECNITVLPIELFSFTAKYISSSKKVSLKWTTLTEKNSAFFTIERTIDGINFEEIVSVNGAENSISLLNYIEFDENPLMGLSYYRLKQTDYDGHFTYSELESILIENDSPYSISVYPNPSSIDELAIKIQLKEKADVDIKIYNEIGALIFFDRLENISQENYSLREKLNIKSGIIYCFITINEKQFRNKIVIN